ncbi:MAG TPA: AAA family ATPase [Nitriliruptorales bacterium]|nr:AAA family ATPase [Nitriliruptorales bacterium]
MKAYTKRSGEPDVQPATYEGLGHVVEASLRHRRSTLVGDDDVWTPATGAELERRVADEPEGSQGRSFDDKLLLRLAGAERPVVLLAADLRFLHVLPIIDMNPVLKRTRLDAILELVGEQVPDDLAATLAPGIVGWGSGHAQALPQYLFLIRFAHWISGLDAGERERVLSDPWGFKEGVSNVDATSAQMEREAVLHLVHPDTFDPVFNQWHKRKIVRRWEQHAGGETDIDRALIAVRRALRPQFGERFHWYEPRIHELWDPRDTTPPGEQRASAAPEAPDARTPLEQLEAAAGELHVPLAWLQRVERLLRDKRQVVFYGPPGTGKTYIAQRLAEALAPDPARRVLVQFHPSTSYEDFFEGYRPRIDDAGEMVYKLVEGPLPKIAVAAASDPDYDHVLVVDEINRANLPRVLGELLFLVEYRDRAITTLYRPDEPFSLPANLLLVGTMNTADRSIALIDAALRRRFHFVAMFPDAPPIDGLLARWTEGTVPTRGGRGSSTSSTGGCARTSAAPTYRSARATSWRRAWTRRTCASSGSTACCRTSRTSCSNAAIVSGATRGTT